MVLCLVCYMKPVNAHLYSAASTRRRAWGRMREDRGNRVRNKTLSPLLVHEARQRTSVRCPARLTAANDLPDKAECSGIKQALAVALVVPEPASGIGVAYSGPSGLFRGLVASDFSLTAANALNFLFEILHLRRPPRQSRMLRNKAGLVSGSSGT